MRTPYGQVIRLPGASFVIYRLEGYISNLFIIDYQGDLLLLDAGAVCDAKIIEQFCRDSLHRSPADIKLAFVSHIHPDHAGGLQRLRERYGIKVAAHRDIDRWYAGVGGFVQQQIDSIMMLGVGLRNRRRLIPIGFDRNVKPDFKLDDNDPLPFFSDWTALYVPGHTLHDLVIYNRTSRLLYAGDCICDVDGKYLSPLPLLFRKTMRQSYDKMAALKIDTILLAHGQPVYSPLAQHIFEDMKQLLDAPPSWLTKPVNLVSLCSPEVWRNMHHYK
jgi:glyoxylase-like metal-dependent hydrolase (beta-lactamase superfamily II)